MMNIVRTLNDNKLFGPHFKSDSWNAWRAFLAALFGLPLTHDQLVLFQQCTGRSTSPTNPLREAWLVVGRRVGKSFDPGRYRGVSRVSPWLTTRPKDSTPSATER
jgi:hypothetical protein